MYKNIILVVYMRFFILLFMSVKNILYRVPCYVFLRYVCVEVCEAYKMRKLRACICV